MRKFLKRKSKEYLYKMSEKRQSPAANYVFTWNNYTKEDEERLAIFAKGYCRGLIYGREIAPTTGTPHLQGYFQLKTKKRITGLVKLLKTGIFFDVARGEIEHQYIYCGKDKDMVKYGEFEKKGGSLSTIRAAINACRTWSDVLDIEGIQRHMTYARECWANRKPEKMEGVILRGWQQELFDILMGPTEDRVLYWVHDSEGGKGKTFFAKYMMANYGAFYSSPAKAQDIVYAYDNQRIFMYDVPCSMDDNYLNWGMLEKIKDGIMFSGKYVPITKVRNEGCHVVIFSNHYCPDGVYVDGRIKLIDLDIEKAKLKEPNECIELRPVTAIIECGSAAFIDCAQYNGQGEDRSPPRGAATLVARGKPKIAAGAQGAHSLDCLGSGLPSAPNTIGIIMENTKEDFNDITDEDDEDSRFNPFY